MKTEPLQIVFVVIVVVCRWLLRGVACLLLSGGLSSWIKLVVGIDATPVVWCAKKGMSRL